MCYVNHIATAADLAEAVVRGLTVPLEASGRHVHLSQKDMETLFGVGGALTPVKELSQPGQFACRERVTLVGSKGELKNVVVLGPCRGTSQVEISLTDAVALGVSPPLRQSGDTENSAAITLQNGERTLNLPQGLIIAARHIHLNPTEAAKFGVTDGQLVRLKCLTNRPVIFEDVLVRVHPTFSAAAHLDYDEANACGYQKGNRALIM